jgi:hypothetical protein
MIFEIFSPKKCMLDGHIFAEELDGSNIFAEKMYVSR